MNTIAKTNALFGTIRFAQNNHGEYMPLESDIFKLVNNKSIESNRVITLNEVLTIVNESDLTDLEQILFKDWIFNKAIKSLNGKAFEESYVYDDMIDVLMTIKQDDFAVIDMHPFSCNKMYKDNKRTNAYNNWWNDFPTKALNKFSHIDFYKPICAIYYYDHLESFDTHNFDKALTDRIASYFAIDDHSIRSMYCKTNKLVDSYQDGKIYIYLCNIKAGE